MQATREPGRAGGQPRLSFELINLRLRNPFRLSYGVSETRRAFWLRLHAKSFDSHSQTTITAGAILAEGEGGLLEPALAGEDEGWGEGTIPSYYHVPEDDMLAAWQAAAQRSDPFPDDPAGIPAWVGEDGPAPARRALDLALHDRIARRRRVPLYELLGLPRPVPLVTSFTIAIAEPEEMARLARAAAGYPVLKIKLGSDDDEVRVAAVRAARPDARLRVDANTGWSGEEALRRIRALERYDLEMVEQPVARDDIDGLGYVQAHTHLPVIADESLQGAGDLERLAAVGVRGINLKLMKVGGLAPGVRMLLRARSLGLQVMLGCMIETSLGTTAMAHLAGLADWLDLDAPLLVANDPFDGLSFGEGARVTLPERPGIGAVLRERGRLEP